MSMTMLRKARICKTGPQTSPETTSALGIRWMVIAICAVALSAAGCQMSVSPKNENGKGGNVDIKTPMGALKVRASDSAENDTGIAIYPGARRRPDSDTSDHDSDSAHVNLDLPWFGMKLNVVHYESDDSPQKVISFYRSELAHFGKVLECSAQLSMNIGVEGNDNETREPSCKGDHPGSHGEIELKVGTHDNQHIVAVKPNDKGTKFDLVFVQVRKKKGSV